MLLESYARPLSEGGYYGKNPLLLEIEKNAEVIRQKCMTTPYYDPTHTPEHNRICELFKELFNFEDFILDWSTTHAMVNSMTIPLSCLIFTGYSKYDIMNGKYGVQFRKPDGKIVFVMTYTSLFTVSNCSAGEWVSIILHELGHNFYLSPYKFALAKMDLIMMFVMALVELSRIIGDPKLFYAILSNLFQLIILCTETGRRTIAGLDKLFARFPILRGYSKFTNALQAIIMDLLLIPTSILNAFKLASCAFIPYYGIVALISLIQIPNITFRKAYHDEKFSDNFVTRFGYGPELATVMQKFASPTKMGAGEKFVGHVPVVNKLFAANAFLFRAARSVGDCHPDEYTRIADQAKLLEHELASDSRISPAAKKQMIADLKAVNKAYSQM